MGKARWWGSKQWCRRLLARLSREGMGTRFLIVSTDSQSRQEAPPITTVQQWRSPECGTSTAAVAQGVSLFMIWSGYSRSGGSGVDREKERLLAR